MTSRIGLCVAVAPVVVAAMGCSTRENRRGPPGPRARPERTAPRERRGGPRNCRSRRSGGQGEAHRGSPGMTGAAGPAGEAGAPGPAGEASAEQPPGCRGALLPTKTKIKHLVVIFGENISFDHYFLARTPTALNGPGEAPFVAATGTPAVNNLTTPLDPTKTFYQRPRRASTPTCSPQTRPRPTPATARARPTPSASARPGRDARHGAQLQARAAGRQ